MKILLKRDITGEGFPHPDQLEVGELALNCITGKMYTKLVNGTVVEFVSQNICFEPTPTITLEHSGSEITGSRVPNFCCIGDSLVFIIDNLRSLPKQYSFEFEELTTNRSQITISEPTYTSYTQEIEQEIGGQAVTSTVSLRKAVIPIDIIVPKDDVISIFKFSVVTDGKYIATKTITISCIQNLTT